MKKAKFVFLSSLLLTAGFTVTACGEGGPSGPTPRPAVFNFVPMFETGRTNKIFANEPEVIEITEYNSDGKEKNYSFTLIDGVEYDEHFQPIKTYPAEDYITVEKATRINPKTEKLETVFNVTPKGKATLDDNDKLFEIGVAIRAPGVKNAKALYFTVDQRFNPVNTGYNFASNTEKKAEILGQLEEYAMKKYLTGITLFENGGYVRYSPRVHILTESKKPDEQYVPGYGFGLLAEGYLDDTWTPVNEEGLDAAHMKYLFSATSSDAGNIAGWDAQGSQVSDLYSYITSSFWSTRLKYDTEKQDYKYEWFPLLAKKVADPKTGKYDPIPLDGTETDTIHKKYRVYLKTDELSYNYMGANGGEFHRRHVALEDYITTFQVLLTKTTGLFRGGEFASDDSYGLKGAYSYFNKTNGATDEVADKFWKDMQDNGKIGIIGGHDEKGDFIDFEFKNPLDTFTAKYVLSSNLYSPIPKDFLRRIGEGGSWINGAKNFGKGTKNGETDVGPNSILYNTLCLGPYYLERWYADQATDFKRDDTWFEYASPAEGELKRYRIPGVHLRVVSAAQTTDYAIYNEFKKNKLDSTGIPASKFQAEKLSTDLLSQGDATFKLNVNSIDDQDTWDQMFLAGKDTTGKYSKVSKAKQQYQVKKWMGNKHFLNGLFWSIDRATFAKDRGVVPSTNFFSNAYLSDPINGDPYNMSSYHLDAQTAFDPELYDTLGFDRAKATNEFNLAISELVKHGEVRLGSVNHPTEINISIDWMYQSDIETYGNDIVNFFYEAFNDAGVADGLVKLKVNQPTPGANWELVYDEHLKVGSFDLGFGAISGNTLSPLNFMEVLKSDNSSLFTLNWGTDTSIVDPDDPIVIEVEEEDPEDPEKTIKVKKEWSYDAAWAAADHGSVIQNGSPKDSVKFGYTSAPKDSGDNPVDRLVNGGIMNCPLEFVDIDPGTEFEITRIEISLVGAGSLSIDLKDSKEKKWIEVLKDEHGKVTGLRINFDNTEVYETEEVPDPLPEDPEHTKIVTYTFSQWINHLMFEGMHNQKKIDDIINPAEHQTEIDDLRNPFSYQFYGLFWWVDIYYNVTIKGSVPTENYYSIKKTSTDKSIKNYEFVK